jgi:hypothetical protein
VLAAVADRVAVALDSAPEGFPEAAPGPATRAAGAGAGTTSRRVVVTRWNGETRAGFGFSTGGTAGSLIASSPCAGVDTFPLESAPTGTPAAVPPAWPRAVVPATETAMISNTPIRQSFLMTIRPPWFARAENWEDRP